MVNRGGGVLHHVFLQCHGGRKKDCCESVGSRNRVRVHIVLALFFTLSRTSLGPRSRIGSRSARFNLLIVRFRMWVLMMRRRREALMVIKDRERLIRIFSIRVRVARCCIGGVAVVMNLHYETACSGLVELME